MTESNQIKLTLLWQRTLVRLPAVPQHWCVLAARCSTGKSCCQASELWKYLHEPPSWESTWVIPALLTFKVKGVLRDIKATQEQTPFYLERTKYTFRLHNATQYFQLSHLSSPQTFCVCALSSLCLNECHILHSLFQDTHIPYIRADWLHSWRTQLFHGNVWNHHPKGH